MKERRQYKRRPQPSRQPTSAGNRKGIRKGRGVNHVEALGEPRPASAHMRPLIGLHGNVSACHVRCGNSDNGLSSQRRPCIRQRS